jgi:hypothetical protein
MEGKVMAKIPFACRIGWHDWSKWVNNGEGIMENSILDTRQPVTLIKRTCPICGLIEKRLIRME